MTDAEKHQMASAMTEFMVNPNMRAQAILERAMRMYQTSHTAMEPLR